jgi:hypothetical protein
VDAVLQLCLVAFWHERREGMADERKTPYHKASIPSLDPLELGVVSHPHYESGENPQQQTLVFPNRVDENIVL